MQNPSQIYNNVSGFKSQSQRVHFEFESTCWLLMLNLTYISMIYMHTKLIRIRYSYRKFELDFVYDFSISITYSDSMLWM